jgi:large subunit ribosomal protein L32e
MKRKKPKFRRQEWWKRKRLKNVWRKPKGRDSKLKKCKKGYGYVVKVGWGSPKTLRGKNWLGLEARLVSNVNELDKLEPKKHMVVIAHGVGAKKRSEIIKKAEEYGFNIANK